MKTFHRDLSGYTTKFSGTPDPLPLASTRRHRPTVVNTIVYKPEVETVPPYLKY